jgi:hypothetical protein
VNGDGVIAIAVGIAGDVTVACPPGTIVITGDATGEPGEVAGDVKPPGEVSPVAVPLPSNIVIPYPATCPTVPNIVSAPVAGAATGLAGAVAAPVAAPPGEYGIEYAPPAPP